MRVIGRDQRIGAGWGRVLDAFDVGVSTAAVEIGPGFTDKIAHALRTRAFDGDLHVVEPNEAVRSWVTRRYGEVLPRATIHAIGDDLSGAHCFVPPSVDVLLMNHALDDMLLATVLQPTQRNAVFAAMVPGADCPTAVRRAWHRFARDPALLERSSRRVVDEVCCFVRSTRPAAVVMAQCESSYHRRHGLGHADRFGADLLDRLRYRLGGGDADSGHRLRGLGQDPSRWLISRPPRRRFAP